MFRSVTSNVSALWSFVANGHQAMHPVSASPSKIPYGGFSPVRLQTGLGPSPSLPGTRPTTYRRPESRSPASTLAPRGAIAALSRRREASGSPEPSGPEALGSPAGCIVPSGRCLLWPHPRLQFSLIDLWFSSMGLCLAAESWRFPALLCLSFCPCRLPYPGGSSGECCFKCHPWQPSPICEGLGIRDGPRNSRFTRGVSNEAAQFALCCGPDSCLPCTDTGRLRSSFHPMSYLAETSNMTTRRTTAIAVAGLAPAGQAALQAATQMDTDGHR